MDGDLQKLSQNTLVQMLTKSVLSNGVDRQAAIVAIRNYINTTEQSRIKRELGAVTSIKLMMEMQAVGVPSWLSATFFTVWGVLNKQRGGG